MEACFEELEWEKLLIPVKPEFDNIKNIKGDKIFITNIYSFWL